MNHDSDFQRLLHRSLVALLVCGALVTFCYWFVDRPVAFFVYHHGISNHVVLKWLTYPPPILQSCAPAVLAALMIRRAWGPFRHWELTLLAAGISIIIADQFRQSLSFLFGRYWPETWINNNPSLIGNDAYGFHPFQSGSAYGSFPSGHTARVLSLASVFWVACPKWRWACVVAALAIATGLLGMNYHFVGDVIAGGFVGSIVGVYIAHGAGLARSQMPEPPAENASAEQDPPFQNQGIR